MQSLSKTKTNAPWFGTMLSGAAVVALLLPVDAVSARAPQEQLVPPQLFQTQPQRPVAPSNPPASQPALPAQAMTPRMAVPPVVPTVRMPVLSVAQVKQLQKLLASDTMGQGLALARPALVLDVDNDTLVREALDHARAVHAGRLSEADFQRDWGMRPPSTRCRALPMR
jgi:hypothetical protein